MKKYLKNHFVLYLLLYGLVIIGVDSIVEQNFNNGVNNKQKITKLGKDAKKKARDDFFFNIMRDPLTNTIPKNIRTKELNHAKIIADKE